MASTDLELLIGKLTNIQKQLGGPNELRLEALEKDEFNAIKVKIAENINLLAKKQEERDAKFHAEGRSTAVIRLASEIRDLFSELDNQLGLMKDTLRRQKKNPKKYPESQVQIKEKQFEKYSSLVDQLKARAEGEIVDLQDQPSTLAELKMSICESKRKYNENIDLLGNKGVDSAAVQRELNEIESEALRRFKQKDEEIDGMLNEANEGLDRLKDKVEVMGEQIDIQDEAIDNLKNEINKAHSGLVTSNARLKKVLFQYRNPSKFCLDVTLILLLLGLIAIIIKLTISS